MKPVSIVKASGSIVEFDEDKLRQSLERTGAGNEIMDQIVTEVRQILQDGTTTKEIYRRAFQLLRRKSRSSAARYKLKRAIFELGPTGYPFEKFVGELLRHQGYTVEVGVIIPGNCVSHEIDVVASKNDHRYMVECKFHRDAGRKCNVQVPLYIQSRFLDVEKKWKEESGGDLKFHQGWIVTNTQFTEDAIQYGTCMGLRLISWDYPAVGSLKERIETSGLHPITCLTSLSKGDKQALLDDGVVLCNMLLNDSNLLKAANIDSRKERAVQKELEELLL